ncbi:hypothetical protein [Cohnella rhizosphaerae]|uniref:hypothetical protein n=1 Tax=Cohnella rhizosphaerae TaxID=1457232 RepID=UPI0030B9186A
MPASVPSVSYSVTGRPLSSPRSMASRCPFFSIKGFASMRSPVRNASRTRKFAASACRAKVRSSRSF